MSAPPALTWLCSLVSLTVACSPVGGGIASWSHALSPLSQRETVSCASCHQTLALADSKCTILDQCMQCQQTKVLYEMSNGCMTATPHCPMGEYNSFVLIQYENGTTASRGVSTIGAFHCAGNGKWEIRLPRKQPAFVVRLTCYQFASSNQQSPIDISDSKSEYDASLTMFALDYYPNDGYRLTWGHVAHGFYIYTFPPNDRSTYTSSATDGIQFYLYQMHAHWGSRGTNGSEHLLHGIRYPGELHFVHYNRDEYGTFDNAVGKPNGLTVIAVFLEIGANNDEFDKILNPIKRIEGETSTHNDTESHDVLGVGFDYTKMIPSTKEYFAYTGSLTSGNYQTCVGWTVFHQTMTISAAQFDVLYSILPNNFRNAQPPDPVSTVRRNFRLATEQIAARPVFTLPTTSSISTTPIMPLDQPVFDEVQYRPPSASEASFGLINEPNMSSATTSEIQLPQRWTFAQFADFVRQMIRTENKKKVQNSATGPQIITATP